MRSSLVAFLVLVDLLVCASCGENTTPEPRVPYSGTPTQLTCVPNLDGVITSDELGAAYGISIDFLISPQGTERTVSPLGVVASDGGRVWDWGEDHADDQALRLSPEPLGTQWYADHFPGAQLVLPLDALGETVGVYSRTQSAFIVHGTASRDPDPPNGRTLLVYEDPIALFRFPLEDGQAYTASSTITNGLLFGLPFAGRHTYEVALDGTGELLLPQLTFTLVQRVTTRFIVEPAIGNPATVRQIGFVFECFGEVARATSRTGETDPNFTTAAEVRRVGQSLF